MNAFTTPQPENKSVLFRRSSHRTIQLYRLGTAGVLTLLAWSLVLWQTSSLSGQKQEVIANAQLVQSSTYALSGGVQHALDLLNQGTTSAQAGAAARAHEAWKQSVIAQAAVIRSQSANWKGEEKQVAERLLTQVNEMDSQLGKAATFTRTLEVNASTLAAATIASSSTLDSTIALDAYAAGVVRDAVRISYNPQLAGFINEEMYPLQDELVETAITLVGLSQQGVNETVLDLDHKISFLHTCGWLITLAILGGMTLLIGWELRRIQKKNQWLANHVNQLAAGMLPRQLEKADLEIDVLTDAINRLTAHLHGLKAFAETIGQSESDADIQAFNNAGALGDALSQMRERLRLNSEQTHLLLLQAQQMTEQMRMQEEETRQNAEQLQAIQQEMQRTQLEVSQNLEAIQKDKEALLKKIEELEKKKK
jgi:hypothetical protein